MLNLKFSSLNCDYSNETFNQENQIKQETSFSVNDFNSNLTINSNEKNFNRINQEENYKQLSNYFPTAIKLTNVSFYYNKQLEKNTKLIHCLNNLNLNTPFSSIYALLGPSGCGKTTLLKIILGQLKPIQGTVTLFGFSNTSKYSGVPGPGIGYMPQELALILDLTINEILTYFSRLYYYSYNDIKIEIKKILILLQLTNHRNKLISQLSGGQQRRVSLACTLIHKPRLLILDEPTVGVDPILKERIWNYLVYAQKQYKTTIIITTHYIEEAKRANIIAFLRNGSLLVEQSPKYLFEKFNTNSLEKLFYILQLNKQLEHQNTNRDNDFIDKNHLIQNDEKEKHIIKQLPWIDHKSSKYNSTQKWFIQFFAIIRQHLILTLRKPEVVLAQYILPIVAISFFCVCIGSTPNGIKLAIINYENCSFSNNLNGNLNPNQFENFNQFINNLTKIFNRKYLQFSRNSSNLFEKSIIQTQTSIPISIQPEALESTILNKNSRFKRFYETLNDDSSNIDNFETTTTMNNDLDNLDESSENTNENLYENFSNSCFSNILINSLNNYVFTKIPYSSRQLALEDVRKGKLWGALTIKKNFSKAILAKIFFEDFSSSIDLLDSITLINSDVTNKILTITMDVSFTRIYPLFIQSVLDQANALFKQQNISKRFNLNAGKLPVVQEHEIFGNHLFPTDFFGVRDFAAPGVLIVIVYSVSFALTVFNLVIEISHKMFDRHLMIGVSTSQLIFSHLITRFLFTSSGTVILLYVSIYFFQVACRGSFFLATTLLLMQSYCAMTHGMVISALSSSLFICAAVSNGYLVFVFIVSGVLWSYETLPTFMKIVGIIQPITIPCESLRSILTRGQGLNNIVVIKGFLVTFSWILIHLILSIYMFNSRRKSN